MRKLLLLTLLALTGGASPALAQITITADEMQRLFAERQSSTSFQATSTAGAEAIVENMGTNTVYDFTTFTYDAGFTSEYGPVTCSDEVPGCDNEQLAAADLILRIGEAADSTTYTFYDIDGSSFSAIGVVAEASGEGGEASEVLLFDPPLLFYQFPVTAGSSWTDEATTIFTGIPAEVTNSVTVEGYGTLRTPAGEAPALKLRRTLTISIFGIALPVETIEFITEGELNASIALDDEGAPLSVSYSRYTAGSGTATEKDEAPAGKLEAARPNPARSGTLLAYSLEEAGPVRLAVYDGLGREVAVLAEGVRPAGRHEARLDTGRLAAGVYVYTLEAGGRRTSQKVVVVK